MALNETDEIKALRGLCVAPFFDQTKFPDDQGFIYGRFCQEVVPGLDCCIPCPMADYVYPDFFRTLTQMANWVAVVGATCCVFLLASYTFLSKEQTHRYHQSVALTFAVLLMAMGFIIPLIAQPEECANQITPLAMDSSAPCAASGSLLLFGGFAGVMWVLMRAVSLHLQICWGVVVGRGYMWFSQAIAWLIPVIIVTCALIFSGVSFRFGQSCHINHRNSLADFWIPLLIMSSTTLIVQLGTFGYCLKVYLASLRDTSASTEGSSLPYTNSMRTVSPRQAFRRIRRVLELQWRGIVIVLIIISDVIFFTVVFVWQDRASEDVKKDPSLSREWTKCLIKAYASGGDKNDCLKEASSLVMNEAIVTAVLLLMALNGVWLMLLLGRWSMFTGWAELFRRTFRIKKKQEFVSVDARYEMQKDQRSYEMLSRDSSAVVTPLSAVKSPASPSSGMRTPDYFGRTARYNPPARSFSSPRPPQSPPPGASGPAHNGPSLSGGWDALQTYAHTAPRPPPPPPNRYAEMNPLGMNRI